jgi:hypothetical protein
MNLMKYFWLLDSGGTWIPTSGYAYCTLNDASRVMVSVFTESGFSNPRLSNLFDNWTQSSQTYESGVRFLWTIRDDSNLEIGTMYKYVEYDVSVPYSEEVETSGRLSVEILQKE